MLTVLIFKIFKESRSSNNIGNNKILSPHSKSSPLLLNVPFQYPNIYFIILDMYARNDQLLEHLKFDNRSFTESLKEKDFYIVEQGQANYPLTYLSITATFDMEFHPLKDGKLLTGQEGFTHKLQGDNKLIPILQKTGYKYIHVDNGYIKESSCNPAIADRCIYISSWFSEADETVLGKTPLLGLLQRIMPSLYYTQLVARTEVSDLVKILPSKTEGPFLFYAHTLATHPPYIRNSDCSLHHPTGEDVSNLEIK